ncbi:MAG: NYN domain-containing protein [Mesorhizobium sp.]|nr:MAG: NYN domain-containing protein [Mesorhizobium sp.]
MPKVAIYIDGPYFLHGVRGQGMSMDLDLAKLLASLLPMEEIVKTVYFNVLSPKEVYPDRYDHERVIFERFEKQGIEPRYCRTEIKAHVLVDRGVEAGIATAMTLDAARDRYDLAVVVSRRAELADPIKAAQSLGKRVTVLFFEYETDPSNPLKDLADTYLRLEPATVEKFRKSGPRPPFCY